MDRNRECCFFWGGGGAGGVFNIHILGVEEPSGPIGSCTLSLINIMVLGDPGRLPNDRTLTTFSLTEVIRPSLPSFQTY